MPKAALLEIYDSHDEILYSQLLFLQKGGFDTTLIISEAHRGKVGSYETGQHTEFVQLTGRKGLALWKELWRIRSIIIERGIDIVIVNTAHSNPVRNFCLLPFPTHIKFYGVLHGVNKLKGSLTQRIISNRIPNYFLLIDYMLEKAMKMPHEGLNFGVFYPIFHPAYPHSIPSDKPAGQLWIAIPGSVEYKRRDYLSLIEAFAKLPARPNVRFFLLGNGYHPHGNGADLQSRINALGISDHFILYNKYVPDEHMHALLEQADAVMPLIHPINADMEKYLENQISGSFHLAFGHKLPLLLHDYYKRYEDFVETGIFYDLDNIGDRLQKLTELIAGFSATNYSKPRWTLEFMAEKYCAFLKSQQPPNKE